MKRLLTILFLCCCISMYGQNNGQYYKKNNTQYPKNNGSTTTKSKNKDSINKEIKDSIKEGLRKFNPEVIKKAVKSYNKIAKEISNAQGTQWYLATEEEIRKVFGGSTINKLREIGYTDTIMKNGKGKYDLRPIQNYIDKRGNDIYQWIKDEKNCEERLNKGIASNASDLVIKIRQRKNLDNDTTLDRDIKKVQAKGKKLGVGNIEQAEDALTDLENLKTELINACVGNCLTK